MSRHRHTASPAEGYRALNMVARPKVSIIIPSYNHAQFLGEAVESALNQGYRNHEIIVVDDGSTDNTKEVISSFGEKVRYIWQENQGLSAARNTGLMAAEGELIGLLDADDLYEPEFLETLISVLMSDSTLDGVHCAAQTVDHLSNSLPQKIGKSVAPEQFRKTVLDGGYFPPLCMFAYKQCYLEMDYLFDEALNACEDWDMWLRFSRRFKIIGIGQPLARYRVMPDSMSRDPIRMSTNREAVLRNYFSHELDGSPHSTRVYQRAFGRSHVRTAAEYLQVQDPDTAYQYFRKAVETDPKLLDDPELFYELTLGAQPMGYRGDFETIDLKNNAPMLIDWLDEIFKKPDLSPDVENKRRKAYANAYWVFGSLSYGKREFKNTRQYFAQAIMSEPSSVLNIQLTSTFLKSLFSARVIDWLKERRKALAYP